MSALIEEIRIDLSRREMLLVWTGHDARHKITSINWVAGNLMFAYGKHGFPNRTALPSLYLPKGKYKVHLKRSILQEDFSCQHAVYVIGPHQKRFAIHGHSTAPPHRPSSGWIGVDKKLAEIIYRHTRTRKTIVRVR